MYIQHLMSHNAVNFYSILEAPGRRKYTKRRDGDLWCSFKATTAWAISTVIIFKKKIIFFWSLKIICVLLWFSIAISKDFCTEDSLIGMKSKFSIHISLFTNYKVYVWWNDLAKCFKFVIFYKKTYILLIFQIFISFYFIFFLMNTLLYVNLA